MPPVHDRNLRRPSPYHTFVRIADPLGDEEGAFPPLQLPRELGGAEFRGGEDRHLRVRPADVHGAAGVPAVGADRHGVVPREPGAREGERNGGDAGQDAQLLPAEPPGEEAHDAEEARVP